MIFLVSLWIVFTCNVGFWRVVVENSPPGELQTLVYTACFLALTVGLVYLVLLILSVGRATRFTLSLSLLVAAAAGYFTAQFGILFDTGMLINVIETDRAEALELMSLPIISFVVLVGLLPALIVWRVPLAQRRFSSAVARKGVATLLAVSLIAGPLYAEQREIFSVARNHSELRHMIAPLNVISASYSQARDSLKSSIPFKHIALDATHVSTSARNQRPSVHVLIVGETARAASFSLNGYRLDTNPELEHHPGVNFLEAVSCGTATAVSLPCMFSIQDHNNFDRDESRNEDNLLDIVARSGYEVYWIDNGNGCKGICSRVINRDVHASVVRDICPHGVCFDEILDIELENIVSHITHDTLIVLHQLGSHGPAYFRRYPEDYRVFRPDCRSANFGDCSAEEISNAYDNTIAYTDHIIGAAIDILSRHSEEISASLMYVSDHGESLGEHNVFLHGMPYKFAPDQQTRVPLVYWLSADAKASQKIAANCDPQTSSMPVSHDNLFYTELGLLEIKTSVYKPEKDLLWSCRPNDTATEFAHNLSGS